MSRITLKPLDDGQKAVEIPIGKTTIGRGPFLGCSDKKVSRNHAVLEVTNKGEVFLTPTHVNPCFYQPTADSPGQILKKDIPHKLENGDSFSLLPRAFRYQLIVTGENTEDKADQNDLNKESGKTNGAAVECEEALLNERNKDSKPNKGISNEELNDGNSCGAIVCLNENSSFLESDTLVNLDETERIDSLDPCSSTSQPSNTYTPSFRTSTSVLKRRATEGKGKGRKRRKINQIEVALRNVMKETTDRLLQFEADVEKAAEEKREAFRTKIIEQNQTMIDLMKSLLK